MKFETTALFSEPKEIRKLVEYRNKETGETFYSLEDYGVTLIGKSYPEPIAFVFADSMLSPFFNPTPDSGGRDNSNENEIITYFLREITSVSIHELLHCVFAEDSVNDESIHDEINLIADSLAISDNRFQGPLITKRETTN